ncbi:MAG: SPOR domain-containing protein [SAR86 cluster bacterium]|jgi:hypothetical protein|uniref:SPOR domain-containing protein n=1 Tax=SAR86 cluster bacterium TaxID=2030880 RepID=A0A520N0P6_9GAMM|nr:MAG: SPOR domain-containing protein [Gammaproteobacteria bacterium TMED225]RZO27003.1 MAG: SPOR domain-containing protein [SAR86 cluster bacterium]|tara:strand:- start:811 stop:1344 length:534 start_codon:yes stop_codon:yes gene_type:complete
MKDFANIKKSKRKIIKKKSVFTSNRPLNRTISSSTILFLIFVSFSLVVTSMFYFKTDVISFKPESSTNSISIDFPSSLLENSVLIEFNEENSLMNCNYFVQIGAYGNKKYAIEAMNIINDDIEDITINEVYSSLLPGKLLNSVISGPYSNRSSANNAKEKITKMGFDPRLRTVCKEN